MSRAALRRIYRRIPKIDCKGRCHEYCGPIAMQGVEAERIERTTGEPLRTCETLHCPYLKDERCEVYSARPTICRLWGVSEDMPCQYGCTPERVLTREETHEILAEMDRLDPRQRDTLP